MVNIGIWDSECQTNHVLTWDSDADSKIAYFKTYGNGNPLQYSCLENPMDRGAWWATVHGVARVGQDWATKPPPQCLTKQDVGTGEKQTGEKDVNLIERMEFVCKKADGICGSSSETKWLKERSMATAALPIGSFSLNHSTMKPSSAEWRERVTERRETSLPGLNFAERLLHIGRACFLTFM